MTGPFGAPEPYTCDFCDGPSEKPGVCRYCWYGGAVLMKLWAGVVPEGFGVAHTGGGCFCMEACPRPGQTIYIVNAHITDFPGSEWHGQETYDVLAGNEPPGERMAVTGYLHDPDPETDDGDWDLIFERIIDRDELNATVSEALIALQGR